MQNSNKGFLDYSETNQNFKQNIDRNKIELLKQFNYNYYYGMALLDRMIDLKKLINEKSMRLFVIK